MIRTQIQLTETQARDLKALAKQRRVSMAELIRRGIDQYLRNEGLVISDEERRRRALSIVGKWDSGLTDISVNHDKYLEEIYMDWYDKRDKTGDFR